VYPRATSGACVPGGVCPTTRRSAARAERKRGPCQLQRRVGRRWSPYVSGDACADAGATVVIGGGETSEKVRRDGFELDAAELL
jgi:hypothetical protein